MFQVQGVSRGVKVVENFDKDKPKKIVAGIATPKKNGFDGEEVIVELVLSKEQIEGGLASTFNQMRDQTISCEFDIRHGAMNGKAWLNLSCVGAPRLVGPKAVPDPAKVVTAK